MNGRDSNAAVLAPGGSVVPKSGPLKPFEPNQTYVRPNTGGPNVKLFTIDTTLRPETSGDHLDYSTMFWAQDSAAGLDAQIRALKRHPDMLKTPAAREDRQNVKIYTDGFDLVQHTVSIFHPRTHNVPDVTTYTSQDTFDAAVARVRAKRNPVDGSALPAGTHIRIDGQMMPPPGHKW